MRCLSIPVDEDRLADQGRPGNHRHRKYNLEECDIPSLNAMKKDDFVQGVLQGNRMVLARAITLIESTAAKHQKLAQEVLQELIPHSGHSVRIGITGVPGVGKSTFIEAFGLELCDRHGRQTAVLTVDPSSQLSRGSILGDKTRMEKLANHPRGFIRPSPSGNTLGGVARRTRETILLCEAFGFDVILVETVGVGQSETLVREMTDFFMVLLLAGAGDELQGIKKGIIEMGDGFLITKADGDNKARAQRAAAELQSVLHVLSSPTPGWSAQVDICSALDGTGVNILWDMVQSFLEATKASGIFEKRRTGQIAGWFDSLLQEKILDTFLHPSHMSTVLETKRRAVIEGRLSPPLAVQEVIGHILGNISKDKKS